MVSSTEGSPTSTCWKRRSSAASFSMYLRYSSSVVAPTSRRLTTGEHRLDHVACVHRGFTGGSGADDGVQLVDEGDDLSGTVLDVVEDSLEAFLEFTAELGTGDHGTRGPGTRRSCLEAIPGTSPATMRWARPSTIAVLPTPGSPMSTGLFLVRRESTCTTRRISVSRPITGSSLPLRAASVRSVEYFSSAW